MAEVLIRQACIAPLVHALTSNGRRRPIIRDMCTPGPELAIYNAELFREHMGTVGGGLYRASKEHRALLDVWYKERCKVFTSNVGNDRRGGYCIINGLLLGLHHVDPGKGDWLMRDAIKEGAETLVCYGTPKLLSFYNKHGFRAVKVESNRYDKTGPMIYHMTNRP